MSHVEVIEVVVEVLYLLELPRCAELGDQPLLVPFDEQLPQLAVLGLKVRCHHRMMLLIHGLQCFLKPPLNIFFESPLLKTITNFPEGQDAPDLIRLVPLSSCQVAKIILHMTFEDSAKRILHDQGKPVPILISQIIMNLHYLTSILGIHDVESLLYHTKLLGQVHSLLGNCVNVHPQLRYLILEYAWVSAEILKFIRANLQFPLDVFIVYNDITHFHRYFLEFQLATLLREDGDVFLV